MLFVRLNDLICWFFIFILSCSCVQKIYFKRNVLWVWIFNTSFLTVAIARAVHRTESTGWIGSVTIFLIVQSYVTRSVGNKRYGIKSSPSLVSGSTFAGTRTPFTPLRCLTSRIIGILGMSWRVPRSVTSHAGHGWGILIRRSVRFSGRWTICGVAPTWLIFKKVLDTRSTGFWIDVEKN